MTFRPIAYPLCESAAGVGAGAPAAVSDFAAFEARENAAATGGTWPDPAATTATTTEVTEPPVTTTTEAATEPAATMTTADPAYTPPNPKSKRSAKDQEFINERIRTSVAEATAATARELAEAKRELDALKARASAQTTEPSQGKAPAPSQPVSAPAEKFAYPSYAEAVEKTPDLSYDQWEIDRLDAYAEWRDERKQAKDAAEASERTFTESLDTWHGRRTAYLAAHPERAEAVQAFLDTVRTGTPIGDALMDSEHGAHLADYLAANPHEAERIARLPPLSAIRALGRLESQFATTVSTTTSASASAGPAAKLKTTAPAPPPTLAARSADPADPVRAAVERGDYLAFEAEENRRAVASSR